MSGKLPGVARKLLVVGIYIPPQTKLPQVANIMNTLNDEISRAKIELHDPLILVGGDFNKKPYVDTFDDFSDIQLLPTGPTRGTETLDLVFTNIPQSQAHIKPPLESDDGSLKSDHSTV